jgi:hypothetical protein
MITIVWDVDDVLNDLMREWFDGAGRALAVRGRVRYDDLTENPPHDVLGISLDQYLASLDGFRQSHYRAVQPLPESHSWFVSHGRRARHIALTAVPSPAAHLSAEWVIRHYGAWIHTFAFAPSRGTPAGGLDPATKPEYLEWIGKGDVYVDDSEQNVLAAESLGLRGVLLPRPWNRARSGSSISALECLTALLA